MNSSKFVFAFDLYQSCNCLIRLFVLLTSWINHLEIFYKKKTEIINFFRSLVKRFVIEDRLCFKDWMEWLYFSLVLWKCWQFQHSKNIQLIREKENWGRGLFGYMFEIDFLIISIVLHFWFRTVKRILDYTRLIRGCRVWALSIWFEP